jgi:hypothetical protein
MLVARGCAARVDPCEPRVVDVLPVDATARIEVETIRSLFLVGVVRTIITSRTGVGVAGQLGRRESMGFRPEAITQGPGDRS